MKTVLTLFSSALLLAGCGETIEVGIPAPPHSYMVCDKLTDTPDLSPLEALTLNDGRVVYLKADVDARDARIAEYVVAVRGNWFSCHNALKRIADYYEEAEQ